MRGLSNNSQLAFDYVLIIEWLNDEAELRTGESLHTWIQGRQATHTLTSHYVRCEVAADVLDALRSASASVSTRGIPIVHFEAHGFPPDNGSSGGLSGTLREGERLPWEDIWPLLRNLNVATGYNLIIVSAACYGDFVDYGISNSVTSDPRVGVQPIPFMASLGYSAEVRPASVRNSMKEFYRGLLLNKALDSAVADANRELSEQESLEWLWPALVIARARAKLSSNEFIADFSAQCLNTPGSQVEASQDEVEEIMRIVWETESRMISRLLGYETHPENRARFPWSRVLRNSTNNA